MRGHAQRLPPGVPLTRWFSPGRVNLIGEHTDYDAGLALPIAIQTGCRATVTSGPPGSLSLISRQKGPAVTVPNARLSPGPGLWSPEESWAAYPAGVVWARGGLDPDAGLTVEIDSDLPVGAGLASSAAICCAVAGAVVERFGGEPTPELIAELAMTAESEFVGAPTGGLDQLAVTRARAGHAMLCDIRDGTVEHVPMPLADTGLALVVVDTGSAHAHAGGEYAERRAACAQACAELGVASLREATAADLPRLSSPLLRRRVRHVLTENARVLDVARHLRAGSLADIGPLLTESHDSMRADYEITEPGVDAAVAAMLDAGALGARMTGGGFGGCVIALVVRDRATHVVERVRVQLGRDRLWSLVGEPSDGARRVQGSG